MLLGPVLIDTLHAALEDDVVAFNRVVVIVVVSTTGCRPGASCSRLRSSSEHSDIRYR
jgi:hypothetical protein